jgi:hypothetical protein
MVLERLTSGETIVWNRVKGSYRAYRLVWVVKLLLPQHTHLLSPTRPPS